MNKIEELQLAIEVARRELDASLEAGNFEVAYEKSKFLDNLIEQYLDKNTDCK